MLVKNKTPVTQYHRWLLLHSSTILAVTVTALAAGRGRFDGLLCGIATGISFFALFLFCRPPIRAADAITLIRPGFAMVFVIITALHRTFFPGYGIVIFLILLEMTDFIDGYIARKQGASWFGGILDEESDAFFTFILAYVTHFFLGFGAWVLFLGLFSYIFRLLFLSPLFPRSEKGAPSTPGFRIYAKVACVFTLGSLIAQYAPFDLPWLTDGAAITALALLSISFLWESVLRFHIRQEGTE
jgi:phosphatidylglycerophosphate synthase